MMRGRGRDHRLDGAAGGGGDPAGQRAPGIFELRTRVDPLDQPDPVGLGGADPLAGGGQQQRLSPAGQGGQSLGAAPGRHDGQRGLGEADRDVVRGDPDVGGHRYLGAAAEGVPVQRRDDRGREGGDPVAQAAHAQGHGHRLGLRADLRELLEVATGDEGAIAAAADDQDVGGGRGVQNLVQGVHGREADGIAHRGAVHGQDRHALLELEQHIRHQCSPFRYWHSRFSQVTYLEMNDFAQTVQTVQSAQAAQTSSGLPLQPVYGPRDRQGEAEPPDPGRFPFTRGNYPNGYRGRLWTIRQYSGFGTAEDSNRRYR